MLNRPALISGTARPALRAAAHAAALVVLLALTLSLVPSDEAYYRVERVLSHIGPLGSASQHLRSLPGTMASVAREYFQERSLEVEGVDIDLDHAVRPTSNVERGSFASQALGEDRTYWVYLPPNYEASNARYPALYLLHGMSQGPSWWTEVARVDRIVTSMIESGKIPPLIVVMPDGNRIEDDVSTTSLYDDHCQTGLDVMARAAKLIGNLMEGLRIYKISCDGDFEDYIVNEVVSEIDSAYRTNGGRYIGGFSVGGRGALNLALAHGGLFDGAFGLSGNYDYFRNALEDGEVLPADDMRLFLASGDRDQRGVYGELNTFLLHKDLARSGVEHLYCTYHGTHSDMAWVSAMPSALQYLLAPRDSSFDPSCAETAAP
jgi:enterochelin esterase-like enzyme